MAAGLSQQLLLQQAALGALSSKYSGGVASQPLGTHPQPAQAPGALGDLRVLTQRPASADISAAGGGSPMHTQGSGAGGPKAATTPARKGMLRLLVMLHSNNP